MSSTFTLEFGHEYEKERGRWLRRRFLWYSGVIIAVYALTLVFGSIGLGVFLNTDLESAEESYRESGIRIAGIIITDRGGDSDLGDDLDSSQVLEQVGVQPIRSTQIATLILTAVATLLILLMYLFAFRRVKGRDINREDLLRLVSQLIILSGCIGILNSILGLECMRWTATELYGIIRSDGAGTVIGRQTLSGILATHFIASLFLPWTPRESLRPIIPLAVLGLAVSAFYSLDRPVYIALFVLLVFMAAVPGLIVCWLRNSRFRSKFHFKMITRRYGEMKDELSAARQIHDAMFPQPITEGPVRMRYSYEPMRQIGGDYLFAHRVDTGAGEGRGLLVVLLDVTGHGITAALTVNRLQGEIERQVSLNRSVTPGTVLSGLNDYLHHTLARHSVYATALVMRIDPDAGTVVWASAGHPPGFLCTIDGTIHHLDSTTIVLGATRGEHFETVEEQLPMGRGDTLLAYTDGVIEAKNDQGRMLRIEGLEKFIAGHCRAGGRDEDVPKLLLEYVNGFRFGPAEDDSLIVEITRPVN